MTENVSPAEQLRRQRISESCRRSAARQRYYARIRGVPRGRDSLTTRARKSASHLAPKGTWAWEVYYRLALDRLRLEAEAERALEEDDNHDDCQ